DPFESASAFLAIVLWILGYPERATRIKAEANNFAVELNHANTLGHVNMCGAEFEQLTGDISAILTHAHKAIDIATKYGLQGWRRAGTAFKGWAVSWTEGPTSGIPLIKEIIAELDSKTHATWHMATYTSFLAQIHARLGDFHSAVELSLEARQRAQRAEEY